jgi:two-component system NtrC family sensor kinase
LSFHGGSVAELAKDFGVETRSYDGSAAGWVARHRVPVDSPDIFADDRVQPREWWRRWGLRSFSAYPVIAGGELVAVLSLSHSEPLEFSRETREVLDLFIAQAGVAIQNARLYRAAQQRRDVAEALARLGRGLTGTLEHAHIARLVAQGVVELLGTRNAAVYRLEPDAGTLHTLAWSGVDAELFEGVVLAPGEGVAGRAVAERRLVSSADILRDPDVSLSASLRARLTRFGHRLLVAAPLIARDQVIGSLVLGDDDRRFSGEELQAFQAFADQAALALDNARLYAAARENFERLRETQAQLVQAGKLSALGQLVSGVAHELNNPLSVIIGYGQLLSKRPLADSVRRPLDMIVSQADRMARIVHNLLYFARQRPPAHAPVDLHQIIEQTLALRLNQLTLSGIVVERDFAADLPLITGDLHQLQQVFLNLLLNAEQAIVAASDQGGRIVFQTRVAESGLAVRAAVIDDGPGIPEDALPRVFEPFFTTKDVGAGTGLGLSVSYGIAQEHHGRLTAESRPGRTIFTLELPLGELPASARAAVEPAPAGIRGEGRLALVVEDEPAVRDLIVTMLEDTGWRVHTAVGGRAALRLVWVTRYDLIVSDVRMPDGSGRELYRGVVDHDASLTERFVFITGDTANPAAWDFLKGTKTPVLEKPFSTDVFLDAVRRTASRKPAP